jgi:hypothetical protein
MMGRRYRARRMTPAAEPGPGSPPDHGPAAQRPAPLTTPPPGTGPGSRAIATWSGVRHPIVAILLLISFFTAISGKPIDGMLMLLVAAGLARDGGAGSAPDASAPVAGPAQRRPAAASLTAPMLAQAGHTDAGLTTGLADAGLTTGFADTGQAGGVRQAGPAGGVRQLAGRGTTMRRRRTIVAAWLACGTLYAAVVGSFSRFSWPATVAVIGVGTAVVLMGWHGPVRDRLVPGPLPGRGTALWGGLLVAGGSWELSALLQQPNLAIDSYAHPTISSLTDPLLGSHPGRSLALAVWLGLGWLVVRR